MLSAILLVATSASLDTAYLEKRIKQLEAELPQAKLGVAVKDLKSGQTWTYRGHERFPMQSVFKFPLGVAALRASERRKLDLEKKVTLRKADLSVPMSLLNQWFAEGRKTYTVERLFAANRAVERQHGRGHDHEAARRPGSRATRARVARHARR